MCLGILIVLMVHQLFMVGVSQLAYKYLNTDPAWYPARTMAALITRTVKKADREALPALLGSLRETLHRRIDLLSADAGKSIIYPSTRKFAGEMTYGDYNGHDVFCSPVLDANRSLLIDPGYSQYRRKPSILFHALFLAFGFLLTAFSGVFLSLPIIRNLKSLEEGIEKIRMGDLSTRVDIPQNMPTGHLAECLNHMVQRIQSLLKHQKHLIQAAAHEIRTPVSRIRFHLEMLTDGPGEEERGRLLADIGGEVEELDQLVSELVTYSALDALTEEMETAPVLLHGFLAELAAYHRKTHGHMAIVLEDTVEENLTVHVNPVYFRRAIQNILSNALRHAREKVTLRCRMEEDVIGIEILDDGPGIPPESRETVLHPFTRLDGSRSRDSGGFGLGLAIVDRIVSLHGGTVSISGNAPCGARVTTFWPK
jgi:two-component system sensor histidine kinase RstB